MSNVQKVLQFILVRKREIEHVLLIGVTNWGSPKTECSSQMYDLHGI